MNEVREGASTCALSGKYIYCIGGRGNEEELYNSIEVLDTSFPKLGWSLIELQSDIWIPIYFGISISIDAKHILISGGMNAEHTTVSRSYILDAENYKIEIGRAHV